MTLDIGTYEEAVAAHEWRVPERYNIAADCCDKHPADKLAMVHEDHTGAVREVRWGELQEMSNRFANGGSERPDPGRRAAGGWRSAVRAGRHGGRRSRSALLLLRDDRAGKGD